MNSLPAERNDELLNAFAPCNICPRNCNADRLHGEPGTCGCDAAVSISSICIHHGEEPLISGENGICNVFFNRCNLSCIYCQNHQISRNRGRVSSQYSTLQQATEAIALLLQQGCKAVGFVSPSHHIPHVKAIVETLRLNGINPVFVYNTNAYDKTEELRGLEDYIDVYLPDYKYSDGRLAAKYSKAADYQQVAIRAIKEMYRQKGSAVHVDENGNIERGLIVRHLVLPGHTANSIEVLRQLADISTSITVSLMAQYYPASKVKNDPLLGRTLTETEYSQVADEMYALGFYKGWVQELDSSSHYRPDFELEQPFGG